jgi:anaerobic ribonucleoside-triphosphate reductase activating protein
MSVEKTSLCVREICEKNQVDGITITGGDPMNQSEEVHELLCNIADLKKEILLYTGYTREKLFEIPKGKEIVDIVDVLIDGKYIEELNDNAIPLRGSTNQNIYYKNKSVENKYIDYLKKGRQLQNFYCQDYMLSLGIHNRGETNGDYAKMAKRNGDF